MISDEEIRAAAQELQELAEAKTGLLRFGVSGYSMLPLMREGDVVVAKRVAIDTLRPGDIVVWKRESSLVIHRLLQLSGMPAQSKYLRIKGDNMPLSDEPVPPAAIEARVSYVVRRGKRICFESRGARFAGRAFSWLSRTEEWLYLFLVRTLEGGLLRGKATKEFSWKLGRGVRAPKYLLILIYLSIVSRAERAC